MGITLADLDRWSPGSVRAVADTAAGRARDFRTRAHDVKEIVENLEWEGVSRESAEQQVQKLKNSLESHADECDQAARNVGSSASEIESLKSEWSRIQRMADRWGIAITVADGSLHYIIPDDPEAAAEVEHHVDIVHNAIVDLLRRADSADQHLAASVNSAISDLADDLGTDHIDSPQDARDTVERMLAGNRDAAAQVKSVLDSITPEQRAGRDALTPLQASVLSQMDAQQHGMSVTDLTTAEQRLGDSKGAISDSWQLMSDPNVHFPKTALDHGAVDNPRDITAGGFEQLPTSVQSVLRAKGMDQAGDMGRVTNIVKDGSSALRQGTDLDRHMLIKAAEMMDSPDFKGGPTNLRMPEATDRIDGRPIALDVFSTAGQDHQAVHDVIRDSTYGERFMKGAFTNDWSDGGAASGSMFSWTGDAVNGPESKLAAETASTYGAYTGNHEQSLLHMDGNQTLGQVNPKLVQGLSHGLAPYVPDIAELSSGRHAGFDVPDTGTDAQTGKLPVAKGIFAVLSTDKDASDFFNGAAGRDALHAQLDYAGDFKNGVDVSSDNHGLRDSMTLQGLVDSGIHSATDALDINEDAKNAAAYAAKKSAYEIGFAGLDAFEVPGADLVGKVFQDAFIGEQPTGKWDPHALPDLDIGRGEHQVLNALSQSGVPLQGLPDAYFTPPDPAHPDAPRRVLTFQEFNGDGNPHPISSGDYADAIKKAMNDTMGANLVTGIDTQLTSRYNAVTEDVDPQK